MSPHVTWSYVAKTVAMTAGISLSICGSLFLMVEALIHVGGCR